MFVTFILITKIKNYPLLNSFSGHYRLKVTFSKALPIDITCLLFQEYPSSVFLSKNNKVVGTFL